MLSVGHATARCTFHEEPFAAVASEMAAYWDAHYAEAMEDADRMPCQVNVALYMHLAVHDQLCVVTMRHEGALVGYVFSIVAPHPMACAALVAHIGGYYIAPAHRQGWQAVRLLRAMEEAVRQRGACKLFVDSNHGLDIGALLRRQGWHPVSTQYAKWLGEELCHKQAR